MAKIEMTDKNVKIDGVDISGSLTAINLYNSALRGPVIHIDMVVGDFETRINGDIIINQVKMPDVIKEKILAWSKKELKNSL